MFKEVAEFVGKAGELVAELSELQADNATKRVRLGEACVKLLEETDDLVSLIPGYPGQIARQLLDNPVVDPQERELAYNVLGQWAYDTWLALKTFFKV